MIDRKDQEKIDKLTDIVQRHINCIDDYEQIKATCPKRLLSRGVDIYGMYFPEKELEKYFKYCGKPTKKEDKKHYAYYFDDQERLRLTERYVTDGTLGNLIFYYYYDNLIEIVWYCCRRKMVHQVGFIQYKDNVLSKFTESVDIATRLIKGENIDGYIERSFDEDDDFVLYRSYSLMLSKDGTPWIIESKMRKH